MGCAKPIPRSGRRKPEARSVAIGDSLDQADTRAAPGQESGDVTPVGRLIGGRWRVEGLLGRGGMGEVYRVFDERTKRARALKVIHPALLRSDSARDRFQEEAALTQDLVHERIARTFEVGDADGDLFYLMELLEGGSLRDRIVARDAEKKSGARPQLFELVEVLTIVEEILDALAYAHDRGVVHRDIKPENVLLTTDGHVKLADFGLAKLVDPARLASMSQVAGTPLYMAPEQLKPKAHVDARADLYAVGVILYELLVGEVPLGAFQPPSADRAELSADLDRLVLRALARRPESRLPSAREFRGLLAEVVAISIGAEGAHSKAGAVEDGKQQPDGSNERSATSTPPKSSPRPESTSAAGVVADRARMRAAEARAVEERARARAADAMATASRARSEARRLKSALVPGYTSRSDVRVSEGRYSGKLAEGKPHGLGVLEDEQGRELYAGEWSRARRQGLGVGSDREGRSPSDEEYEAYVGQWSCDRPDGFGVLTIGAGISIAAEFRAGEVQGVAVVDAGSDRRFEGELDETAVVELGVLRRSDGSHHAGEFKAGVPSGLGVSTTAEGDVIEGRWVGDELDDAARRSILDRRSDVARSADSAVRFDWIEDLFRRAGKATLVSEVDPDDAESRLRAKDLGHGRSTTRDVESGLAASIRRFVRVASAVARVADPLLRRAGGQLARGVARNWRELSVLGCTIVVLLLAGRCVHGIVDWARSPRSVTESREQPPPATRWVDREPERQTDDRVRQTQESQAKRSSAETWWSRSWSFVTWPIKSVGAWLWRQGAALFDWVGSALTRGTTWISAGMSGAWGFVRSIPLRISCPIFGDPNRIGSLVLAGTGITFVGLILAWRNTAETNAIAFAMVVGLFVATGVVFLGLTAILEGAYQRWGMQCSIL